MDEIKNQNEKINELIEINIDKDNKINKLEYKYNEIINKINELDKINESAKINESDKINESNKINESAKINESDKINNLDKIKELDKINELDKNKRENAEKGIIELLYRVEKRGKYNLFGLIFELNNRDNFKLNINKHKIEYKGSYMLEEGDNIV